MPATRKAHGRWLGWFINDDVYTLLYVRPQIGSFFFSFIEFIPRTSRNHPSCWFHRWETLNGGVELTASADNWLIAPLLIPYLSIFLYHAAQPSHSRMYLAHSLPCWWWLIGFRTLAPSDLPTRSKLHSFMSRIHLIGFILRCAFSTVFFLRNRYIHELCVAYAFSGVSKPLLHEQERMFMQRTVSVYWPTHG